MKASIVKPIRTACLLTVSMLFLSCEITTDSSDHDLSTQASNWWPYQVGDSMVYEIRGVLEHEMPFVDTFIERVTREVTIEGHRYFLFVKEGYHLTPFPDSSYYRIEGSKIFKRPGNIESEDKSEYEFVDFALGYDRSRPTVPFTRMKDTSVVLHAGKFDNCVLMKGGVNVTMTYSIGVGLVIHDFVNVATERLIHAGINGKVYP